MKANRMNPILQDIEKYKVRGWPTYLAKHLDESTISELIEKGHEVTKYHNGYSILIGGEK